MNTSAPTNLLRVAATALAGLLVATLAACGTGSAASAPEDPTLLPEAEGAVSYPLTIESGFGEVTLEERPTRIVLAESWGADVFGALGITPVGTDEQISLFPWALDAQAIESVWSISDEQFPLERIAAVEPDLIYTSSAVQDNLAELQQIAPVIGVPRDDGGISDWRDQIHLLGSALDLQDRAQQVEDDYDAYTASVREAHPEFAGALVAYMVFWGPGEFGVINYEGSAAESLFGEFGFALNPTGAGLGPGSNLTPELVGRVDGDVVVLVDQSQDQAAYGAFVGNPLFQGIRAVQAGKFAELDNNTDEYIGYEGTEIPFVGHFTRALSAGPLGRQAVGDVLVPILAQHLGGA